MRNQLRNIKINKFIVHDIPSKYTAKYLKDNPDEKDLSPVLSDTYTSFSDPLTKFFKDKIIASMSASSAFDIVYKPDDNVVPKYIEEYFEHNNAIKSSRKIAVHLHDIQNARNSGGLLLFIYCNLGGKNIVAILKVEREEGVQINSQKTKDGKTNFNMSHIENLMLTNKTKLFKIVMFYKDDLGTTKGILSDQQMGFSIGKEVAHFFLNDFLGCMLVDEPSVTTKKFFDNAQKFINESSMSQQEKANAMMHTLSLLTDNTGTVNLQAFAEDKLNEEFADDFITYMKENGVSSSFIKNTELISKKLNKRQFVFESGVSLIAPEGVDNDVLCYSEDKETGKMKVQITDTLKRVNAK